MIVQAIKRWLAARAQKKAFASVLAEAEKAAKALDIMLSDAKWYGGVRVVETPKPQIEVLIVNEFPGALSTFIPPRIGAIPVLVRFGSLPKAL
jgi:hypothetical protein